MSVSGFFFMLLFVGYWYLTWKIFKRYMFDLSDLQGALFWFVAALGNAIVLAAVATITDVGFGGGSAFGEECPSAATRFGC